MTRRLFLDDAYLASTSATVLETGPDGIVLDRTVFYARGRLEAELNALIAADHPVRIERVDDSVLDTDPGLVRTMSVKPPRGAGQLRLIRIGQGNLWSICSPAAAHMFPEPAKSGRFA